MIKRASMMALAVAFLVMAGASAPVKNAPSFDPQKWVQREVEIQISRGRMGHFQRCPMGFKAGVGFSTRGPAEAVRQCCFWYGTKRPAGVRNFGRYPKRYFHVQKSGNRWYAAALYRN